VDQAGSVKHQNSLLHLEALWVDQQSAHQCSVTKSLTEQYSQWAASCIHITCILGKIERFARFMQHKLLMNVKACYSQILQYISQRRKPVKKEQIPHYIAAFAYITNRILIRNESGNLQELKFIISFALLLSHMPYSKSSDRLQILFPPTPLKLLSVMKSCYWVWKTISIPRNLWWPLIWNQVTHLASTHLELYPVRYM
jgi:hypothetical protein